jgi:hypothetical protein
LGVFASEAQGRTLLAALAEAASGATVAQVAGAKAMVPCARLPHTPSTQAEALQGLEVTRRPRSNTVLWRRDEHAPLRAHVVAWHV